MIQHASYSKWVTGLNPSCSLLVHFLDHGCITTTERLPFGEVLLEVRVHRKVHTVLFRHGSADHGGTAEHG